MSKSDIVDVQCSSTCGAGEQVRAVVCRRNLADTPPCSPQDRPSERRACRARIPCHGTAGKSTQSAAAALKFIVTQRRIVVVSTPTRLALFRAMYARSRAECQALCSVQPYFS